MFRIPFEHLLRVLGLAALVCAVRAEGQESKPTDAAADPLPPGAIAQFGSLRLQDYSGSLRLQGYSIERSATFSPDGKFLVTYGLHTRICVWDVANGKLIRIYPNFGSVSDIRFKPDGKLHVLNSFRRTVFLMQELKGPKEPDPKEPDQVDRKERLLQRLLLEAHLQSASGNGKRDYLNRSFLSGDGKWVVAVWSNGISNCFVERYAFTSGKTSNTAKAESALDLPISNGVCLSPDGKFLIAHLYATKDQAAKLSAFDLSTKKDKPRAAWELTFPGRMEYWPAACFCPDGRRVLVVFWDTTVELWDGPSGKRIRSFGKLPSFDSNGEWGGIDLTPDGKRLALLYRCPSGEMSGRIVDLDSGNDLCTLAPQPMPRCDGWGGNTCSISPDGKRVARISHGIARIWNAETGADACPLPGHRGWVYSLIITPDGKTALSAGTDFTVRAWDPRTGKEKWRNFFPHMMTVKFVTPDARFLVVAADYRDFGRATSKAQIDLSTGKVQPLPGKLGAAKIDVPLAICPDGTKVVTLNFDKPAFHLWSWPAGELLTTVPLSPPDQLKLNWCEPAHFTADGKQLVVQMHYMDPQQLMIHRVADLPFIEQWDLPTGKMRARFDPGKYHRPLLISDRDGIYASLKNDGIYDVISCRLAVKLHGPENEKFDILGRASAAALSPDGRTLVIGNTTFQGKIALGKITLYEMRTGKLRGTLMQPGKSYLTGLHFFPDGRLVSTGNTVLVWSIGLQPRTISSAERHLHLWWDSLSDPNPQNAWPAMEKLAGVSPQAVELIRKQVRMVPKIPGADLDRIFRNLGSAQFKLREAALTELDQLGPVAVGSVKVRLVKGLSIETRRRVLNFLAKHDRIDLAPVELRALRAVEVLEAIATPSAKKLLQELAGGEPGARLTQEAAGAVQRLEQR